MISSFQMILEDGSIHLDGEAMQKLLTSQLKILLLHGFKLHLGTTRALDWEIHERSSKWNSLHYLNPGCHNKHLIRTIVHLQINKDLISMKQLNA
ncbi:uncharacterized protein [Euphorbia lathyris]|uniref:uncharacterized protein isoform X15 n=1 Tax=Euphorbia lathyris TaxID=212925 RepID=UPI003313CF1C